MVDRYVPHYPAGRNHPPHDGRYPYQQPPPPPPPPDHYERGHRYQVPPPPPPEGYQGSYAYRPRSPPPPPPPPPSDTFQTVYRFKGASERQGPPAGHTSDRREPDVWRPQSRESVDGFSFRAPSGPAYPSQSQYNQPSGSRWRDPRDQSDRTSVPAWRKHHDTLHGRGQAHGRRNDQTRGPPTFKPRPAHNRNILKELPRETTPEQLEGMGQVGVLRFADRFLSEDESEGAGRSQKRARFAGETDAPLPRWSNPDPYTALPPPPTAAPKMDIVQKIRKSKIDSGSKAINGAKSNVDFISLSVDEEQGESGSDDMSISEASVASVRVQPQRRAEGSIESARSMEASGSSRRAPKSPALVEKAARKPIDRLEMTMTSAASRSEPSQEEVAAMLVNDAQARNANNRKRRMPTRVGADSIVDEWRVVAQVDPTPWYSGKQRPAADILLRLHKEVMMFYDFVSPRDHEDIVRSQVIEDIGRAVRSCSNVEGSNVVSIEAFGSFACGLHLPTADLDLVVISPSFRMRGIPVYCFQAPPRKSYGRVKKPQVGPLRKLGNHLRQCHIAENLVTIPGARVPLIKFKDQRTGIRVDISFENDSGLRANETFNGWKAQYPMMPALVVIIKQLMAMHGLNEVVSGGIGGFTIICLVVSMLQHTSQADFSKMGEKCLGELLLRFFDLYGNNFDHRQWAIRMNPPGYVDKILNPPTNQNAERLTILDPNKSDNDISGGSKEIEAVFDVFRKSFYKLRFRMEEVKRDEGANESLLGCILAGNYISFTEQRDKLHRLHFGYPAPPFHRAVSQEESDNDVQALHRFPANSGKKSRPDPPSKSLTTPKLSKQQELEKRAIAEKSRAKSVKDLHPHIPNVPDRLSKAHMKVLLQKHEYDPRLGAIRESQGSEASSSRKPKESATRKLQSQGAPTKKQLTNSSSQTGARNKQAKSSRKQKSKLRQARTKAQNPGMASSHGHK